MKGYLQLKLDRESAEKLKKKAVYPKVFCHHVTIIYGVSEDDPRVKELIKIKDLAIKGKEIYKDENGQALSVDMALDFVSLDKKQKELLTENGRKQNYHVTISTQKDIQPVYSNELLKKSDAEKEPYTEILRGTMEFFPFGKKES